MPVPRWMKMDDSALGREEKLAPSRVATDLCWIASVNNLHLFCGGRCLGLVLGIYLPNYMLKGSLCTEVVRLEFGYSLNFWYWLKEERASIVTVRMKINQWCFLCTIICDCQDDVCLSQHSEGKKGT